MFPSSWIKSWLLGISNAKHSTLKGLSSNSSFISWIFWSTSWSAVIYFEAEKCLDTNSALKCRKHWYIHFVYCGGNSVNIITSDALFLNTYATSCWWHTWCSWMIFLSFFFFFFYWMTFLFNASGRQKTGTSASIGVPKKTCKTWPIANFLKFCNETARNSWIFEILKESLVSFMLVLGFSQKKYIASDVFWSQSDLMYLFKI